MPFEFQRLRIPDVILVLPRRFGDRRGFFEETYGRTAFASGGIVHDFAQDNHSFSKEGVLRGLHFQRPPRAQGKLVRVPFGEIFDVAVDLREGSPTYGEWVAEILSGENGRLLFVPVGFAHGFCVLSSTAHVEYKVTDEYSAKHDGGIAWNDPQLDVGWPVSSPVLSEKDAALPKLESIEPGFRYEEVQP